VILALRCLVGVLLLMSVVGYAYRGSGPADVGPKDDVGGLLSRWLWTATVATALIAAGATIEQRSVSGEELQEAATHAAARADGRLSVDGDLLEVEIADELGREVTVTSIDRPQADPATDPTEVYLVTAGADPVTKPETAARAEGAVCVRVRQRLDLDSSLALRYQVAVVDSYDGICDD
jgi:hypothetical protein